MMDAARWKFIERIYERVSELPADERTTYLQTNHKDDPDLIEQVESLFGQKDEAVGFFESFRGDIFTNFEEEQTPISNTDPLLGLRVAQYVIEDRLGVGGMGTVYRAKDVKLERNVALKVLHPELSGDEQARDRFVTEAKTASTLNHPNVATIYGIEDVLDNRLAIAMMFCEGSSLKERLEADLPDMQQAIQISLQIASGLRAAHDKGVIHRDIKPGNVMLDTNDRARIVDFGLARFAGQAKITKTGDTMGTVAYMAPEQAKGEAVTQQADIWSFGVVLFEMLTGELPFHAETMHAMLYAVINEQPIPLAGLRPDIPAPLEQIVNRALSRDLHLRYKDFQEVISDLQAVQDGKVLTPNPISASEEVAVARAVEKEIKESSETARILVVDDEPDIELMLRQQYFRKIRSGEWDLVFAENGEDALEKLAAHPDIQLILTDIQMPGMDGLTLLSRLKELGRLTRTIVVSAYGDMRNIRKAMNNGAYDFLTKPIQFSDLESTIYKTLDNIRELQIARSTRDRLARLENELGFARRIQQDLLPKPLPSNDEVSVYAFMQPAMESNGDFYDYFFLDDHRLGFFIGEVAGKGFSASMFMAMCRTLLKADAQRGYSPAECMTALNTFLYPEQVEGVFISVLYGILDIFSGQLTYCNAGHSAPYILRSNGEPEIMSWTGGIGIGVKRNFIYENAEAVLEETDGLFLYTDGLLKSCNQEGTLFPKDKLERVLKDKVSAKPSQLIRQVIREVAEFSAGTSQSDDNTVLAIRRTMAT